MLDKKNNQELCSCIVRIKEMFLSDTFILLDCVLTDNPLDPEYSANVAYDRLEEVVRFEKLYNGIECKGVSDYLLKNGYTLNDVELLNKKRIDEKRRHAHI